MTQPDRPDAVWLYRRPILEEWIDRGDVALDRLVRHVLVHEIAHHLGWSDDDIRAVDDWTRGARTPAPYSGPLASRHALCMGCPCSGMRRGPCATSSPATGQVGSRQRLAIG